MNEPAIFHPSGTLRQYIRFYLLVYCQETMRNSMLPGTAPVMGFRFAGVTHYVADDEKRLIPPTVIAGMRNTVQWMEDGNETGNIIVVFRDGCAGMFMREPLHEIFGEVIALRDCEGARELSRVEEQLFLAKNDGQRIRIVEQYLLSRLHTKAFDPLVMEAIRLAQCSGGTMKVQELAKALHTSMDAFEKRFRRTVGASPKQFLKNIRMQTVINKLSQTNLTNLALEAGYYDQAHFNRDFKSFTGITPSEFIRNPLG